MSEDIQKDPVSPPRAELPVAGPDYPDLDYGEEPPYPSVVTVAGVLWILFGCLAVLSLGISVVSGFIVTANKGGQAAGSDFISGAGCGAIIGGLIAALFIRVGIQSVRGTARDTLGNGIGSILFALLPLAVVVLFASRGKFIEAGIEGLVAAILFTAGVLALVGRGAYKRWRQAQKARKGP